MEQRYDVKKLVPIHRSTLRRYAGRIWYAGKRYLLWISPRYHFAKKRQQENLPCRCAEHATPLLRKLKDVEMRYQHNKITNLHLAVEKLDGLLLRPGETMSYWKLIGRPIYKKGYLDGLVLYCGKFDYAVGGGLCQLSNLIFWMTLHTPLTVVERYRHSHDVFPDSNRTQPFGSGATCAYPHRDLMIRNDTNVTYQLRLHVGEENLEGAWFAEEPQKLSYRVVERNHRIQTEYWGGYSRHNEIWREVSDCEGNFLYEEKMVENHALMMYAPLLEPSGQES